MIKNILKGIVIGIANIIPGVSGGSMMVSMGIYDKLIHCINHIFKEFKKCVLYLLPFAIGIVIALIGGTFTIKKLFDVFPLQTSLCFVGLVIGGLPAMWKNVKDKSIKAGHIIAFMVAVALVVFIALNGETEGNAADLSLNLVNVLKLFGVGIIAAATMVIPGVSGSMLLMLMGYYIPIIDTIHAFLDSLLAWDMDGMIKGFGILCPFGIGVVLGILAVAKLVEFIFTKFPLYAYWIIIGLIVASPVAIMKMSEFGGFSVFAVIGGVFALVAGTVISMKLGE